MLKKALCILLAAGLFTAPHALSSAAPPDPPAKFQYDLDTFGHVRNYLIVDSNHCPTIENAIQTLLSRYPNLGTSSGNDISCYIEIRPGIYQESINLNNLSLTENASVSGIHFIGIGDVSWVGYADYPTGALCGYGSNIFENIHFISHGYDSYAYHFEAGGQVLNGKPAIFKNCTFESDNNSAIGIGAAKEGTNLIFENCSAKSNHDEKPDIYFHNNTGESTDNGTLAFINCKADFVLAFDAARWGADRKSTLHLTLKDNDFGGLYLDTGNCGTGKYAKQTLKGIPEDYDNFR